MEPSRTGAADACRVVALPAGPPPRPTPRENYALWTWTRLEMKVSCPRMLALVVRLNPFKTADAKRLAVLFGVVYFAQGMWYLPNQSITIVLKERGLTAGQVADFFLIAMIPWLVKPVYGLLSDAMMVENGRPRGLTGAFQSVQWACITVASVLVGVLGGYLAEMRSLRVAFFLAACFPLISLIMGVFFVRETPTRADKAAFGETWLAIRATLGAREIWLVAGFIFFFWFSPSFGPAFLYYQTDTLKFSQQFIGHLAAIGALSGVVGAFVYAPLSRQVPLKRIMNFSIGFGVAGTLAYLLYRGTTSAVIITVSFGSISMIMQLAFLDLAAKACPRHVEATFFALLMSVFNLGVQLSGNVGARLDDVVGYH